MTKRLLLLAALFLIATSLSASGPSTPADWKARVAVAMPLMGHRNWILVVDSAYPLQSSPGVETIETNAGQLEVVRSVLRAIGDSIHVRPQVYMDAELPLVPEEDAPGVTIYRGEIHNLLEDYDVKLLPHDKVIANIDEAGKTFHVLVLKTSMTIPYSSVFLRLDCKYWSADAEKRLRAKMGAAASKER
jgi:RbsD / FucU transport protein family